MKLAKILDALKEKHGIASNAELGRILGIDKRRIGDYYGTERTPTDDDYAKISLASGIREDEIRAAVKIERAEDETERQLWKAYLKKFGGVAASVALVTCAGVILQMTPTDAKAKGQGFQDNGITELQIIRTIRLFDAARKTSGHAVRCDRRLRGASHYPGVLLAGPANPSFRSIHSKPSVYATKRAK